MEDKQQSTNVNKAKIELQEITTVNVKIEGPVESFDCSNGMSKAMISFTGTVEGPYLKGKILPGGVDCQTIDGDRVNRLSARYMVELDNGDRVFIENNGVSYNKDDKNYFMCTPKFMTNSDEYSWLNTDIFVAYAECVPEGVKITIYRCV